VHHIQIRQPGLTLRIVPALLCMAAIFGLSARSTLPRPESISGEIFSVMGPFGAYLVLGITLWWALGHFTLSFRQRMMFAWAGAVLYGVTDEWHQSFVPGRSPDIRDIVTDALGAFVGLLVVSLLLRRFDGVEWAAR
jgi:VanZ family protein